MKRFLNSNKMTLVGLILVVFSLGIGAGIALSASSSSSSANPSSQPPRPKFPPTLVLFPPCVEEGQPFLIVIGAGFGREEAVFVEALQNPPLPNLPIGGQFAKPNGAFAISRRTVVPIPPGHYTVLAQGSEGSAATYPLLVLPKGTKCQPPT